MSKRITDILLEREDVRVSFHAVEQFCARIARLPEASVPDVISEGVRTAESVCILPDGRSMRVRTRRPFPFEFRAILVYDKELDCPVVTTILRGDSWKLRKQRLRGEMQSSWPSR